MYVAADVLLDYRLWCEAAVVYLDRGSPAGPGDERVNATVAISGASAARLLGIDLGSFVQLDASDTRPASPIEITISPPVWVPRVDPPMLTIVRSRLRAGDVALASRLPVTSAARTAFDLARRLPRNDAVVAIDAMLNKRLVTIDGLRSYLLGAPPVHGRGRVAGVLALAEPLAQSPMESRARLILIEVGLPRPVAQVAVRNSVGQLIGYVDLAYPEQRIGIEYEGDYHRDRATFRRDIARINAMQEAGWVIVRVTARDVRDPTRMLRQIAALLSSRTSPGH